MEIDTGEILNTNTNFFTYDVLNLLYDMNEFENIVIHNENVEINLVPFKINLNGKNPFNTIMLVNDYNESLGFASLFNNINKIENKEMLISSVNCYLYSLFSSYKYNNVNYNITCDISGGSIEYVDNYALKNSISNGRDLIIAKCFS